MKNLIQTSKLILTLLLIACLFTTFISGCKKETTDKTQLIIGKWIGVSEQWEDYINGSLTNSSNAAADHDLFITFKTDGTVIEENFETPSSPIITTYNYSIISNTLIITNNSGYRDELTITELTKTGLGLKTEETYISNGTTHKSIRKMTLRKVS